jgi:hypothetical protein
MVSVVKMTKAWSGALSLLAGITLIGLVSIPSGEQVTVQWSWGDWEPVRQTSKWIALLMIPVMTAVIAWPAAARNGSEERTDLLPTSAVIQLLVMGFALIAQSAIVFVATF